ncbi:MAG: 50S ribosomal protein L13 [Myxococcales bacterium]|nr:50S ribosomal protein L13 [Myxococcales bacterium]
MSLSKSTDSIRATDIEQKWHLVDMDGATLGRAATRIASVLRGKHLPSYTPHNDCGEFVVVINSAKAVLTGRKLDQKMYRYHTNFPGGLKETTARDLMSNKSEDAIRKAVRGMLPKGPLGRQMLKKLKVYPGAEHPHGAQNPAAFTL